MKGMWEKDREDWKWKNLSTEKKKGSERGQRPHYNEGKEGNRISREPRGKINKKRPKIGKY